MNLSLKTCFFTIFLIFWTEKSMALSLAFTSHDQPPSFALDNENLTQIHCQIFSGSNKGSNKMKYRFPNEFSFIFYAVLTWICCGVCRGEIWWVGFSQLKPFESGKWKPVLNMPSFRLLNDFSNGCSAFGFLSPIGERYGFFSDVEFIFLFFTL